MKKQLGDESLAFLKMNSKSSLSNNLRFGPHDIIAGLIRSGILFLDATYATCSIGLRTTL